MRKQSHRVKEKYKKYRLKKRIMEEQDEQPNRFSLNDDDKDDSFGQPENLEENGEA